MGEFVSLLPNGLIVTMPVELNLLLISMNIKLTQMTITVTLLCCPMIYQVKGICHLFPRWQIPYLPCLSKKEDSCTVTIYINILILTLWTNLLCGSIPYHPNRIIFIST